MENVLRTYRMMYFTCVGLSVTYARTNAHASACAHCHERRAGGRKPDKGRCVAHTSAARQICTCVRGAHFSRVCSAFPSSLVPRPPEHSLRLDAVGSESNCICCHMPCVCLATRWTYIPFDMDKQSRRAKRIE